MSDTPPPLPTIGQEAWGDELNAFLTWARDKIVYLEEVVSRPDFSVSHSYRYLNNITPPPANGQMRFNNLDQVAATELMLAYLDASDHDLKTILLSLPAGNLIYVQDRNNSAAWQAWTLTAAPIDNTTYVSYSIAHHNGGSLLPVAGGQGTEVVFAWQEN